MAQRLLLVFVVAGIDQAQKLTMILGFGWQGGERVEVTSFFDYVLVWNTGISFSLFNSFPAWGLSAIMAILSFIVLTWMFKAHTKWLIVALALIAGGALGNLFDRLVHGAVADFFFFHAFGFEWFVFNLADVAITVGIIMWIWDSFFGSGAQENKENQAT